MRTPSYRHSQLLWALWWLAPVTAAASIAVLWTEGVRLWWVAALIVSIHLAVLLLLGRLTIELDDHHLVWRFGYLGWPRWRLTWRQVLDAQAARTTAIDGWGIHRTRRGWLYNASGADAVELKLDDGRRLRLGSDDCERLLSFIRARLPEQPAR